MIDIPTEIEKIIRDLLEMEYALYQLPGTNNTFSFCILNDNKSIETIRSDIEKVIAPYKHYFIATIRKQMVEILCTVQVNVKQLYIDRAE